MLESSGAAVTTMPVAADAAPMTLTVVLRRADPAGFERYLTDVYDRDSPRFRNFLTAQEIADSFGPSPDDFALVQSYFAQQSFTIVEGSANRMTLTIAADRATVEKVLNVTIGDYAIGDRTFYANDSDPELPTSIAARVQAVIGLSDLARPRPMMRWFKRQECKEKGDSAGYPAQNILGDALGACQAAVNACTANSILTADDITDVNKVCDKFRPPASPVVPGASPQVLPPGAPPWKDASGAGQKVGLIQFDTFLPSDVADYHTLFGMPDSVFANLSQVHVNGGATLGADQSEVLLDVNTVLMGAPDAKVVVYDAPFAGGGSFQALFNRAISDGMTIISNSWTYCEDQTTAADVQSIDAILATAAGAGIAVFNASGDSGSTCLDGSPNTIGVPAGSPHATAVGGTSLTVGPTAVYVSETWWNGVANTPPTGQGGFGVSRFFARPAYQNGFTASTARSIPDIAFNADPAKGIVLCQVSLGGCPVELAFGGTSVAAPTMAAAAAIINQAVGHNLGNFNLSLYPLAGTTAFHTAASMGSDFAHVGLGSTNLNALYLALTGQVAGAVDATQSNVKTINDLVAADGTSSTAVVVRLRDANGNSISGKTVTLTASPAGSIVISPASAVTTVANGAAVFTISNLTTQTVTLTATDTTDGVALLQHPQVVFGVPVAASGGISAGPTSVPNDGVAHTTITVTLKDALNRPTPGKLVTLAQGSGHSVVSGPNPGVTDATGSIQFTATDQYPEVVTYTAIDVTDGNLTVPGTAVVTFGGQGNASCVAQPAPAAAAGFTLTPWVTGFAASSLFFGNVNWGCRGASNPAFTPDGSLYANSFPDGSVYKLLPQGGAATSSNKLSTLGPALFGPVVGKDGKLYAARGATTGNFFTGAIYELNPVTGAIIRTVLANLTCPTGLIVDPLSGDLFFSDSCFGAGADNPSLWRVSNPASATPTLSVYTTLPGTPTGWIAIAPDGTIFMPQTITSASGAPVLRISGTNVAGPPTQTPVPGLLTLYWVTVGEALPSGAAKSLIVLDPTSLNMRLADITTNPPTYTDLIIGAPGSGMIGPDGCLYVSTIDTIYKLAPVSGGCGFAVSSPAPALRLTPETAATPQGAQQSLTAQLENLSVPAGTPVYFAIGDANLQTLLGRTDAQGKAVVSYTGISTGTDSIQASATVGTTTYRSNLARVTWTAGKHVSLLTLNTSPLAAAVGASVTLQAGLADSSVSPPVAIAGASIQLTLGVLSCSALTNAQGIASCAVTPTAAGLIDLIATYAGSASFTPATARQQIAVLAATASVAAGPPAIDFGNQILNTTSSAQAVVLTNAGTLSFTLSSIAFAGSNAGDFALGSGAGACVVGGVIAANGGSCTLYLKFTPAALGARAAIVTATDTLGGTSIGVPLAGTGVASAPSCFTGPLPSGGSGTACVTGVLPACQFTSSAFVTVASVGTPPPSGVVVPFGLFQFAATGCGSSLTLTVTYPAPLDPASAYYKFGPTLAQPAAHWYSLPGTVNLHTITVTLTDGGAGDSDLTTNGTIVDPGGAGNLPAPPPTTPAIIPTIDREHQLLLALLLLAAAAIVLVRRR